MEECVFESPDFLESWIAAEFKERKISGEINVSITEIAKRHGVTDPVRQALYTVRIKCTELRVKMNEYAETEAIREGLRGPYKMRDYY